MVEADSHLKLLPTSILDIYKVIEHIDMLSMGIQYQPYTVIPTLLLGSDFVVLGHLLRQNDVIMSWLKLTAISNWFPYPYWTYTKYLSKLICCPLVYSSSTQFYPPYLAQILGFWVTCGSVKMMHFSHGWCWQPPQTASHIHIRHAKYIGAHWYAVHWHMVAALHSFTHPSWRRLFGFWVTCGIKIIWLCHGWGWQPPQTASHIHIRHIQCSWAH
jgi:hypothetical protein